MTCTFRIESWNFLIVLSEKPENFIHFLIENGPGY
ncbi:unnamed protein product [Tenebrio molitor]|nr:unnamed protein product [Tenebrio molitor]